MHAPSHCFCSTYLYFPIVKWDNRGKFTCGHCLNNCIRQRKKITLRNWCIGVVWDVLQILAHSVQFQSKHQCMQRNIQVHSRADEVISSAVIYLVAEYIPMTTVLIFRFTWPSSLYSQLFLQTFWNLVHVMWKYWLICIHVRKSRPIKHYDKPHILSRLLNVIE